MVSFLDVVGERSAIHLAWQKAHATKRKEFVFVEFYLDAVLTSDGKI